MGMTAGFLARLYMLRTDYRNYPSYPHGYIIHSVSYTHLAIVLGSFVNLTLYQSDALTVRFNLGGALVPLAVALYVWMKAGTTKEKVRSLLGAVLTAAAIWLLGVFVVDEYALPVDIIYLYPIIAGLIGYLFGLSLIHIWLIYSIASFVS